MTGHVAGVPPTFTCATKETPTNAPQPPWLCENCRQPVAFPAEHWADYASVRKLPYAERHFTCPTAGPAAGETPPVPRGPAGRPLFVVREAVADDLQRGLLQCLGALAPVDLGGAEALAAWRERKASGVVTYAALLVPEGAVAAAAARGDTFFRLESPRVVGTASLLLERKLLRGGARVGHVEDVAVLPEFQGRGVGASLLRHVLGACAAAGCYKVVLDCPPAKEGFYEKFGIFRTGTLNMRKDLR